MDPNFNISPTLPAEQLVLIGKTAAQTAETSGMSLTDAVVRTVGMTKLNEQQVRRIVEAANHEAFHRKFASMDASMRVVELDGGPADPSAVMERLQAVALPTKVASSSMDYSLAPKYTSPISRYSEGHTKEAAMQPVHDLLENLRSAHDELSGDLAARQADVEIAVRKLAAVTKQAVAEGAYFEDLERGWGQINPKIATEMLSVLTPPNAPAGVKIAGRRISESAEVITSFAHFTKTAAAYETQCEAVQTVEQEIIKIAVFMRDEGTLGPATARKLAGIGSIFTVPANAGRAMGEAVGIGPLGYLAGMAAPLLAANYLADQSSMGRNAKVWAAQHLPGAVQAGGQLVIPRDYGQQQGDKY